MPQRAIPYCAEITPLPHIFMYEILYTMLQLNTFLVQNACSYTVCFSLTDSNRVFIFPPSQILVLHQQSLWVTSLPSFLDREIHHSLQSALTCLNNCYHQTPLDFKIFVQELGLIQHKSALARAIVVDVLTWHLLSCMICSSES